MNTREIFKSRLNFYIKRSGKSIKQISDEMRIPYTTLIDWANGKNFPRADGIERLANYFGIYRSDLLEENDATASEESKEKKKTNTVLILGRDGTRQKRRLTDEQMEALRRMIEVLPDFKD